uniref:Cytochrome c oxidase subunit 7B, mitochondrial n=1 Tax=Neovison vison TaxID=452646 RepID=A0A8C7BR44_NEOVI
MCGFTHPQPQSTYRLHRQVQRIQQTMAKQSHQKQTPDFHDKYGNAVSARGATLCVAGWTYSATETGIEWNRMAPVPCRQRYPKEGQD